jgi:uncharacterized protein YqjF (DUF2071 family)
MSRPILTARWTELLLLNFSVPKAVIEPLVPPGTELDLHDGQAYISIVGFRFDSTRLYGVPVPGHTRFPEINLRYYVRRQVGNETRRGVVFVREIAPRRAVAITANRLFHENYLTRPMRSTLQMRGPTLAPGDIIEYAWRSASSPPRSGEGRAKGFAKSQIPLPFRRRRNHWNRLGAQVAAPFARPAPGSLEEIEHYWGYVRARDGTTREYEVAHAPWKVAPTDNVRWDCDLNDLSRFRRLKVFSPPGYWVGARGGAPTFSAALAEYLANPPTSTIIAAGSPIQLYCGHRI